jgi:hypothetical protein
MSHRAGFDPSAIIEKLVEHRVTFVLIGGYSAELQGVSWMTVDIDIVIEAHEENYIALATALEALDAWCLVPKGSVQKIRPHADHLRSMTGTLLVRTAMAVSTS